MVGYEDAHTRPEDFSPSGHSFLEVLEPVLVERNHVNHVLEAVNMKLFGTPVRRPKTISLLTPGCVRVRLFTSIMHYKEHPYNHSGVSVNGPRAGDPPYSFCEADFPKSPDGGLDLKYVKMWWGIKDCQIIDPQRWTTSSASDVLSPLAIHLLSEGHNYLDVFYDAQNPHYLDTLFKHARFHRALYLHPTLGYPGSNNLYYGHPDPPHWLSYIWPLGYFIWWLTRSIHQKFIPDLKAMREHYKDFKRRRWEFEVMESIGTMVPDSTDEEEEEYRREKLTTATCGWYAGKILHALVAAYILFWVVPSAWVEAQVATGQSLQWAGRVVVMVDEKFCHEIKKGIGQVSKLVLWVMRDIRVVGYEGVWMAVDFLAKAAAMLLLLTLFLGHSAVMRR